MKALQIGICGLLTFAVAAHGAVEPWSQAFFETGAGCLVLIWAVSAYRNDQESVRISPLVPPLLGLILFAIGQLTFGGTVSVHETRIDLQLLLAYAAVLFVATQTFRTAESLRFFIWFAMCLGFAVSLFGILQHLTFNGRLYWVREMRFGGIPFGSYVNRNHFAGFAELVIPISLVPLALGKVRRERLFIVGVLALFPVGALFLCASRGGLVSFAAEMVLLVALIFLRRSPGKHVLAGAAVLVLSLMLVSWLGVRQILERFSSMQTLEVTAGKRASMRHDTWNIFREHPWTGTGLGTLQTVFPGYETQYDAKIVNHSHNDYLEALAETGIIGGLCCAWFMGTLFFVSIRRLLLHDKSFAAALHISGLVGCSGILVHSLVDFNLHIPANTVFFLLMAHLATVDIPSSASHHASSHAYSEVLSLAEITH